MSYSKSELLEESSEPLLRYQHLEALKWFAVIAMLMTHADDYLGERSELIYAIGRCVFPLFAITLAYGVRELPMEGLRAVVFRVLGWACVVELIQFVTLPVPGANILFTLGFGMCLSYCIERWGALCLMVWAPVLMVGGVLVEGGPIGIAAVWLMVEAARSGERFVQWFGLGCAMLCFCLASMSVWPLWAIAPIVYAMAGKFPEVKRVPRVFYWIYAVQFPVFFLLGGSI